ncbi:MAG TPA: VWA domain-containing protein [Candidatus Dormibacteraeota bacterium]|nr:VWA domain-containing protein [Candidatus Dormibacteraeota bacterium]
MFSRCLVLAFSYLLLFSVLAWTQTGDISSPATPGAGDPSLVPLSDTNVSVRTAAVPTNTADQEGKIKFRTQTILIQVPTVVTDKSGNHVHGLTKEAFHVLENGKEQKVATLEEIVTTAMKLPVAPPKPGEFTNLVLTDQQPRPVTVIALDTINTPFLDQYAGRRALIRYLADNLDSGDVLALMVMTSHGLKVVQGLTSDREQLVQLLKKASGEMAAMQGTAPDVQANAAAGDIPELPTNLDRPYVAAAALIAYSDTISARFEQPRALEETLNAFLEIAWSLSGVPGRKSLIWATGGFPFTISSPAAVPGRNLSSLYERTMQALDAAQVSVYPVDIRGLVSNSPMGNAESVAGDTGGPHGAAIAQQISNRTWFQQSTIDTLNRFADMTGGKAFYNTNDLASSLKRAADDASSYYLASYYLDTHSNNSGWRQLKVKVDKKDAEVRAREGFFVTNATMNPDVTRSSDLTYALRSPIEGTGVPLSLKWLGTSGEGANKKAEFLIHMSADGLSIESGNGHLNFDFAAVAYLTNGKTGKATKTVGKAVNTTVPDAQMASLRASGIDMKNALELGPGNYVVRVVIRDNVTGKIGSVTAPLTVN